MNDFQICFNVAFNFNLRRYTTAVGTTTTTTASVFANTAMLSYVSMASATRSPWTTLGNPSHVLATCADGRCACSASMILTYCSVALLASDRFVVIASRSLAPDSHAATAAVYCGAPHVLRSRVCARISDEADDEDRCVCVIGYGC